MARRIRRLFGGQPTSSNRYLELPDISLEDRALIESVRPYTMTSPERLYALVEAVRYVERRKIPGAFVECGVWMGGSVLAMLKTLLALGRTDRDVYLFDTFEGMTKPSTHDLSAFSSPALETWKDAQRKSVRPWDTLFAPERFNLDAVRTNLLATGYPAERLHFVQGPVEHTLPGRAPERLSLVRLDTDWYESTRHELIHLYPRLTAGGVLIIDDYGHWQGCRRAVDEYFSAPDITPVLLQRIDYTGRLAVKP